MPLFPAVKFMDTVIGVDMHAVAPIPGIPIHPYVGPVYLWSTPAFPSINVFINGMPACSVGALGYFFHVPQGVPVPPTPTNSGLLEALSRQHPDGADADRPDDPGEHRHCGHLLADPEAEERRELHQGCYRNRYVDARATWQSIKRCSLPIASGRPGLSC